MRRGQKGPDEKPEVSGESPRSERRGDGVNESETAGWFVWDSWLCQGYSCQTWSRHGFQPRPCCQVAACCHTWGYLSLSLNGFPRFLMTAQSLFMSRGPITKTNNAGSVRLGSLSISGNALIKRGGFHPSERFTRFNHMQGLSIKNMLQGCLGHSSGSLQRCCFAAGVALGTNELLLSPKRLLGSPNNWLSKMSDCIYICSYCDSGIIDHIRNATAV